MVNRAPSLEAPIPGQSLTDEPKKYPWERPAQINTPEEAAQYYIQRLANQDVMDDLAVMFDNGATLAPFVKTLTTYAEMEGVHSIDVGLIVSPVIHAFLKSAMSTYGIEVEDEPYDPNKDPKAREMRRVQMAIDMALASSDGAPKDDPGVTLLQEVSDSLSEEDMDVMEDTPIDEVEAPEMEAATEEQPTQGSRGLMSRGAM